jgi:hypothetical protein
MRGVPVRFGSRLHWFAIVMALQGPAFAGAMIAAGDRDPQREPQPPLTFAQAEPGSAGGTLGKPDKSATGNSDDGAAKPSRSRKPPPKSRKSKSDDDTPPRRATRASRSAEPGGPVPADGSWDGVSSGPCIISWHWTVTVNNGVLSGSSSSGHVSRSGAIAGNMVVFGRRYDFSGRMVGSKGSGSWVLLGPRGCTGQWTATKS